MRPLLLLCLCGCALTAAPRLLLNPARVEELRRSVLERGTPQAEIFRLLKSQVDQRRGWWNRAEPNWNYGRSYLAVASSLLYQITGEPKYAALAFETLRDIHADPDPDRRLPEQGYGLSRATVGLGFAFAWDWAREGWTAEQRAAVRARILAALDAWAGFRHANLAAPHRGSNWVAVCRGGELVLLLAAGLEREQAGRFQMLKQDLREHLRNYDELGVSQEGIGYTAYGGIFLLRALLALRSIGDAELEAEAARHAWWKQAMYSGAFGRYRNQRPFLMSGVGGPTIGDEGWASLLFPFVPREHVAHYQWWYDRHAGQQAPGGPETRFEPERDGRVWALLCYPRRSRPRDPAGALPRAVSGAAGLTFFRDRWRDGEDILLSVHADARHHSHAWDQPEALQLGLHAAGALLIGGPNKTRSAEQFSTLLVDGRNAREKAGAEDCGQLLRFAPAPDGGEVESSGGEQYRRLGVEAVRRRVRVRFTRQGADIVVSDEIRSASPHQYAWQLNLGPHEEAGGVSAEEAPGGFVLKAGGRTAVTAQVAEPRGAAVRLGDPLQIQGSGANLRFEVRLRVRRP